ncbi:hypothetical protein [Sphingomonas sp. 28-63-12]|uniref:hypothetical protein n=1 Tax=Sphingomonas sp. 28-63-12 TaxID=1970434 RepID=UPI000BC5DC9F|nr:MAG: hypothetical protein B7Y47_05955 [Sphingomonas sp. 28-63-12]
MTTTRYFIEQVLRKRAYLSIEMCRAVVAYPILVVVQPDGRIRHWGRVILPNEVETRILRVVTLDDGSTLHNAFIDRNFREDAP